MPDWLQPLESNRRPRVERTRQKASDSRSFERAVERFAEEYRSRKTGRHFSRTSKQNVRDNLLGGPLTAFRAKHRVESIDAWNGELAAEYLQWLQHELRRDSATIVKVRGQLRSFGAFCDEHSLTTRASSGPITSLRVSASTDYERHQAAPLTHAQAGRLLKAAPSARDRLAVAMLLYTGMRPSELLALEEESIHLERTPPVVEIRGSVHDAPADSRNRGFRDVPLTVGQNLLPGLLRAHLSDPSRPRAGSRLFVSLRRDHHGRAQPLTMEGLKSMLATVGEATGIKCNPSRLRHTFCTWCADAGMQMVHLQRLLGLASTDMVAHYYRGKTDDALEAAARVRFRAGDA